MKALYLITIEIEAYTDRSDLLDAIIGNLVTEGLAQYHSLGELDPFETLSVLQSPPEMQSDEQTRVRRMAEDYYRRMHRIIEKRLTYRVEPVTQLAMPGL